MRHLRLLLLVTIAELLFVVWFFFPRQKPCRSARVVFIGDSILSNWSLLQPLNETGLTYDGLHPTTDGYRRMELLLSQAVQNALSSTNAN